MTDIVTTWRETVRKHERRRRFAAWVIVGGGMVAWVVLIAWAWMGGW